MTNLSNSKQNFTNDAFAAIYGGITAKMPAITFWGIIASYLITAGLNVYFVPLPLFLAVPAALAIQFGRFAIVFNDFLNPVGTRSPWPPIIATVATVAALAELGFSLPVAETGIGNEWWALMLFASMVILSGYILEINFVSKGCEAFGMEVKKKRRAGAVNFSGNGNGNGNGHAVQTGVAMGNGHANGNGRN